MADVSPDLEAPVFLVALPQVQDPFFHRSVVLLLQHDDEGSFGFIANRVSDLLVGEILEEMKIEWTGDAGDHARFGGPVQPQMGSILYSASADDGATPETAIDVLPDLRMTQNVTDLARLASAPPEFFRLFLGYAGWGAGQLVTEILRNDWLTAPVSAGMLQKCESEALWDEALSAVGIDPASLPAWTTGDGGTAN